MISQVAGSLGNNGFNESIGTRTVASASLCVLCGYESRNKTAENAEGRGDEILVGRVLRSETCGEWINLV
jgi:hypothetical protein